jgi:hypothetical protein
MVLMVRDPKWLCTYWEIDQMNRRRHRIGSLVGAPLLMVRLYRHEPVKEFYDYTVYGQARTWYIPIEEEPGVWHAELGYIGTTGKFVPVMQSNPVNTAYAVEPAQPVMAPSGETSLPKREWPTTEPDAEDDLSSHEIVLIEDERIDTLDAIDGGERMMQPEDPGPEPGIQAIRFLGGSEQLRLLSPAARSFQVESAPPGASEAHRVFAPGASDQRPQAHAAPGGEGPAPGPRPFWLRVETELIVHGATEPTAQVTVQGIPVPLRADGTFTLRFALPDSHQVIPVEATRDDGEEHRRITPVVNKKTL